MLGVIFDLDQTLLDSSLASAHRKARAWSDAYDAIPRFKIYEGIVELMASLQERGIPMCIVTKSPRSYCSKVVAHWRIPIAMSICYHDVTRGCHKPHPESMNKAAAMLNLDKRHLVAVGDDPNDIIAANAAEIHSVAATWGAADIEALIAAKPDTVVKSVPELHAFLKDR